MLVIFNHYCFAVGVYASSVMINISCLVVVVLAEAEAEVGHWPLCMGVSANTMANSVDQCGSYMLRYSSQVGQWAED